MAINPMQKKARSSFLLGVFITLLICGAIIAFLVMSMLKQKQSEKSGTSAIKTAWVLSSAVKSGEEITADKMKQIKVQQSMIPSDYIDVSVLSNDENNKTIAKVDMQPNTILTSGVITTEEDKTTDDLRTQEYNMIVLPIKMEVGQYIDVRFALPSGEDYIVLSKKKVIDASAHTVWINLTEDEILTMSNAIVEAYIIDGSKLYADTYVEPGMQKKATSTYPVNKEVLALMQNDKNIVDEAKSALYNRYIVDQRNNALNSAVSKFAENRDTAVKAGMDESIETAVQDRTNYLQDLDAAATETDTTTTTNTTTAQ